jgi:hemin uptake protein HemP
MPRDRRVDRPSYRPTVPEQPVRVLEEQQHFDPQSRVEVEHDGRSWPGLQTARRLLDDGRGWLAEAKYGVDYG